MSELRIDRSFVAQVAVDAEDDRLLFRSSCPCLRMRLILIFGCRLMSCVSDGTCICGLECGRA